MRRRARGIAFDAAAVTSGENLSHGYSLGLKPLFFAGILVSLGLVAWHLVEWARPSVVVNLAASPSALPPTGMERPPPTRTVLPITPPKPAFRLSGIALGSGAPLTVINNRVLRLGDTLDGMRVTAITSSSVTLERGSTSLVLRLRD